MSCATQEVLHSTILTKFYYMNAEAARGEDDCHQMGVHYELIFAI